MVTTQHEDLSLTTQTPTYKDLDATAHVYYSRDVETETGGSWSLLASKSNQVGKPPVQQEILSQMLRWEAIEEDTQHQHLASAHLIHHTTYMEMCTYTFNTYTHKRKTVRS